MKEALAFYPQIAEGNTPEVNYALLTTTGEEIFEAVDLEPEIVTTRPPRIVFQKGQLNGKTT